MSKLTGDARMATGAVRPPPQQPGSPSPTGDEGGAAESGIARAPDPFDATASPIAPTSLAAPALAALLDEARAAQAELGRQPLPITNHNSQLIMKLLGG